MDPSSPKWNGYSEGGWDRQRWFDDTDEKGQPVADPSRQGRTSAFAFSDVDGMFGPGGLQNGYSRSDLP